MNALQRTQINALLAFFKGRIFWQRQLHRMHAHFGRIHKVTVTYRWPNCKPERVVTYQREIALPSLGEKTPRGYVVAWDVSCLN